MKKGPLLGKLIFDYRNFFEHKEVDDYRKEMSSFLKDNKDLESDEFFKEFDEKFHTLKVADRTISRKYLMKISSDIKTIKIIVIIYLIASIIGAIAILSQLNI